MYHSGVYLERSLTLLLKSNIPPLSKQFWHHPDPKTREDWSIIYESITSWFCSSNDFRKHYNCVIIINEITIILNGAEIKYLAPNLRSVASLLAKAYTMAMNLDIGQRRTSTPGIYVEMGIPFVPEEPIYHISFGNKAANTLPTSGTISLETHDNSEPLELPASALPQAIVWINSRSALNYLN